jgi:hypothetical protein
LIWLRVGTDGGLCGNEAPSYKNKKIRGFSSIAQDLLASQEGFCPNKDTVTIMKTTQNYRPRMSGDRELRLHIVTLHQGQSFIMFFYLKQKFVIEIT